MNIGRRQRVWSGLTAGVTSAAVMFGMIALKVDPGSPVMMGLAGALICLLTIAVVFPYGAIVDRTVGRLRKAVDEEPGLPAELLNQNQRKNLSLRPN